MRFTLTLMCDAENGSPLCANSTGTCPSGVFSDLRIGRTTLEREALLAGWVRKAPKMREGEKGVIYKTQQGIYCPACSRR